MLRSLVIRDLAIIAALELELKPGLTVITGETGAGKSILLDGLTLIAGTRADASMVRSGAERAEVEAEFAVAAGSAAADWLTEHELEDATRCLLRRTVRADGGSKVWINGRASNLQQARELTAELVEIHGQHEYQRLLERSHQLDLLDRYGNHGALLQAVGEASTQVHQLAERRRALEAQAGQSGALLDLARAQLAELDALKPTRERLSGIEEQHRRLSHAGQLQQGLSGAAQRLAGEEATTALRQIRQAQAELGKLSGVDNRLNELVGRLESVRLEVEDIGGWLADQAESLDLDPAALQRSERELSALHDLARRHRVSLAALPDKLEELKARVQELSGLDAELSGLAEAEANARQRWQQSAQNLSALRQKTAARFAKAVEKLLQELAMSGARFVVELTPRAPDDYAARGAEQAEFLVSANAGQPPRAMRKVASGGELSRISLAIKVATLDIADTPVLIFDEVDAGIGGPTAAMVGRKLRALGSKRQVLVVTHSPQVAAAGHQHWHVGKQTRAGKTVSSVVELDDTQRIEELARMLGGEQISDQTRGNARELRAAAQESVVKSAT